MTTAKTAPFVISGGGIAGLTAALALAQRGLSVTLYEAADKLREVGAGLQLSPNATYILEKLHLLPKLQEYAVEPLSIDLRDGCKDKLLYTIPVGKVSRNRWGSPYLTIHRADLQKILLEAVLAQPNIVLKLGHCISDYTENNGKSFYTITTEKEEKREACELLIAADGVWSTLRDRVFVGDPACNSGFVAWRTTVASAALAPHLLDYDIPKVRAYCGPDAHLVMYPIKKGHFYNLVAVTKGTSLVKDWHLNADYGQLLKNFSSWGPSVKKFIAIDTQWTFWPLYERPSCFFGNSASLIFLGDAAHAVLPFAAQGAAMALEDAYALATALSCRQYSREQAFKHFSKMRQKRIEKVAALGARNGWIYHLASPLSYIRNLALRAYPLERFLQQQDWLYSYKADASFSG